MTPKDFLRKVLPYTGEYCFVGIRPDGRIRTQFKSEISEVITSAESYASVGVNAYFALATFKTTATRSAANARYMKSFFLDLDCGEGKPYEDQRQVLKALRKFLKDTGLPTPIIVNSGRGIHTYWPLENNIDIQEWQKYAVRLKELCQEHGLESDPAVTADAARILRVPGSINFNSDPPAEVAVIRDAPTYSIDVLGEILKPKEDPFAALDLTVLDAAQGKLQNISNRMEHLTGNFQSKFKNILRKSVKGVGCAQMLFAYENQETLEEPLWRAMLSVANVCTDRETAIHVMSKGYPEYNKRVALRKASETKGPYTCETFSKLNPKACEGCTLKIASPVVLGNELVSDDSEKGDVDEQAPSTAPEEVTPDDQSEDTQDPTTIAPTPITIPKYPAPFHRGKNGGVYHVSKDESGEPVTELVYAHDIYVVRRIHDVDLGEVLLMRLHLPHDGVREFLVPLSTVMAQDKLRDKLASQGVTVMGRYQTLMMVYITRWVEELQVQTAAQKSRRQFGWSDDFTSFIIGDREIRANSVEYSPPSVVTTPIVKYFAEAGTLQEWSNIVNYYAHPSLVHKAFALFLGFGNVLLELTNVRGFWLSMYSAESGAGKSTLAYAIASIFGHPIDTSMRAADTGNAFWNRVGIHKNIPVILDEITEMPPRHSSSMLYTVTEGREKERMQAHVNAARENTSRWHTGVVSTSNQSVRSKLVKSKLLAVAEAMRMLEYYIPADKLMSEHEAGPHFARLTDNFGTAAVPYIQYIIKNMPAVRRRMDAYRTMLAKNLQVTGPERFWLAMGTIAMVGGEIANKLGIVDIPVAPVKDFFMGLVKDSRGRNKDMVSDAEDFLTIFIQENIRSILVINGKPAVEGIPNMPIREPVASLVARYEPDTKRLIVSSKVFKDMCAEYRYDEDAAISPYILTKSFLGRAKTNMASGSVFDLGLSSNVLIFDTSRLPIFDEEAILSAKSPLGDSSSVSTD